MTSEERVLQAACSIPVATDGAALTVGVIVSACLAGQFPTVTLVRLRSLEAAALMPAVVRPHPLPSFTETKALLHAFDDALDAQPH